MPIKKLSDWKDKFTPDCSDPEHEPPSILHLEPGLYEYICPRCRLTKIFTVQPKPTLKTMDSQELRQKYNWRQDTPLLQLAAFIIEPLVQGAAGKHITQDLEQLEALLPFVKTGHW